ncbi:MAG TPA: hypothetical protein VGW10_08585, partial [Solirubrobacteraceae bacterium]|nr:hypothetical protein [Solirubrobacteraceae bacterium]
APPAFGAPLALAAEARRARALTDDDLLAGLRRTLAHRRGRGYRHRWLVPGTLRIKWSAGSRVIGELRVQRSRTGVRKVRIRATRRGRRTLRTVKRVRVYASFAPVGRPALRVTGRAVLRRR